MAHLNKVMLIGNVGRDPEVRYAKEGQIKVATLTLATTQSYPDKEGKRIEATEWHNVVAWRNLAELTEKYIRKGSLLYVEGHLLTRSYESNGQRKFTTEVVAESIQMLGQRQQADSPAVSAPATSTEELQRKIDEQPTDDLPF